MVALLLAGRHEASLAEQVAPDRSSPQPPCGRGHSILWSAMSLRERTRPGWELSSRAYPLPRRPRLPAPVGCLRSSMTASAFWRGAVLSVRG
jgi:hypothetical protein